MQQSIAKSKSKCMKKKLHMSIDTFSSYFKRIHKSVLWQGTQQKVIR